MSGSIRTATKIRNLAAETIHLLSQQTGNILSEKVMKDVVDKQVEIVSLAGRMDARTGKPDPSKRTNPTGEQK